MISVSDVYAALCTYESSKAFTGEELFPCCEQGLSWVKANLRDTADENDPLIIHTAAAVADFCLFLKKQTETDTYESYKVGDMTVRRNAEKELLLAEKKRDMAIARAHTILNDGGFYCCGQ
ncbi:MAG: hypothetical protein J6V06_00175 [Clostridia bacterium]|nr:hypothetical protein [Clostridia bacterium]MBO7318419.1 hypothetical protein [Clostridia bacterium]